MIKTELCELLGIKYPIIQAGMGPFGTNKLCIAAANAGVLGLISSSEIAAMNAVYAGDESKALLAGGECAQRIHDLPTVEDLSRESPGKQRKSSPRCRGVWHNFGSPYRNFLIRPRWRMRRLDRGRASCRMRRGGFPAPGMARDIRRNQGMK